MQNRALFNAESHLCSDQDYPFSFVCEGRAAPDFLEGWDRTKESVQLDADRVKTTAVFADTATGLHLTCETISHGDFSAAEWVLFFANQGVDDTPLIEQVQVLDLTLRQPGGNAVPFVLHHTNGAPAAPTDFAMRQIELAQEDSITLGGGGGRSSNKDFPFFRIDGGSKSWIVGVGWSGQWRAELRAVAPNQLRIRAGMEHTRFRLRPGERVRSPRLLVMWGRAEPEINVQFRRLLRQHYVPAFQEQPKDPALYCNTCFTRGGHWLNECDEQNQISLIRALAGLGVQAVITDAGWFEGGWPRGAGNWAPRRDAYPKGMGPVAAAARANNMIYGLWFEPERVVPGTGLDRDHPDWLLRKKPEDNPERAPGSALLNFALPQVRAYFLDIVTGFMSLPGFRCYRQDFNMDPLDHWRDNDAKDRQGIAEMHYIEGLYAYWDSLAAAFPDSFRVNCASGGRRLDLESLQRFHVHQKSDHWFDNTTDQASLFALSQYLPNGVVMAPLNRLDDYSFHSAMAASLCLGWTADGEGFDRERAEDLSARYLELRHLLSGDWYPLTGYSRDPDTWLGSQYHRADLEEGMLLLFRREACAQQTLKVQLHGLVANATYKLVDTRSDTPEQVRGAALKHGFAATIPEAPGSALITYRRM